MNKHPINKLISLLRQTKGLSLSLLSNKTNIPKTTLANLEKCIRKPHPQTLYKLSKFYNINFILLIKDEEKIEELIQQIESTSYDVSNHIF